MTLSNPPAGATSSTFGVDFRRAGSRFSLNNSQSVAVAATSAVARVPSFTSLDVGALVSGLRMTFGLAGGGTSTVSVTRVDPAFSVTLPFDLSLLLPHFETAGVDVGDPVRPTFFWTASGDLTGADYVRVLQQWYAPSVDRECFWEVLAPGSTASPLRFPALPDSLAAFRPPATGSFGSLQFVETTELFDYDHTRRNFKVLIVGTSDAGHLSRNSSFSFSN